MLPSGKVAVLLLVVCMVSPEQVTSKKPICTKVQREKILEKCGSFIQPGHPTHLVSRDSQCCAAVRGVRDMECFTLLLTEKEKTKYSVEKIRALRGLCESDPPPSHKLN
uniref:Bifunctional inhibitor/plant lipid transfer protein/seed storage helical domain-containing protein n=1 Tax=Setaria viridis TaxID=4556 RepID=A0A4U6TEJ4_SETVI|nr:hypothetical protein SEVIR_8G077000v2 [Setaria viridis]